MKQIWIIAVIILSALSANAQNDFTKDNLKNIKAGEKMTDSELYDLNGNIHKLSDYNDRYILLCFWEYGCEGCNISFPEIGQTAEGEKNKIAVIGVNLNDTDTWKKSDGYYKITWPNLNDGFEMAGIAAKYGVKDTPHFVYISPGGTLLFSTPFWHFVREKIRWDWSGSESK